MVDKRRVYVFLVDNLNIPDHPEDNYEPFVIVTLEGSQSMHNLVNL